MAGKISAHIFLFKQNNNLHTIRQTSENPKKTIYEKPTFGNPTIYMSSLTFLAAET